MTERIGDWFCTASGRKVYVLDPRPEDIDIEDVAHALSHLCRFNGHVDRFYSVAQHSVLVSEHVPAGCQLAALLHDASEAYVGDVIRPIKRTLPDYSEIEARWEEAVRLRFRLAVDPDDAALIKLADNQALITERRDIAPAAWRDHLWKEDEQGIEPWPERIEPWDPADARYVFLSRFRALSLPE